MIKYIRYLLFLCLLTFALCGFSQQDTSRKQAKDSLLNAQLDQQQRRVRQLSAERLADSLKRAELERQLSNVDNAQKAGLLKELGRLKQADSLRLAQQNTRSTLYADLLKAFR